MTALRKWDEPQPVKLTVDDFLRLDESGAFAAYAKTELIDGVIVAMNAQHRAHARAWSRLFARLFAAVEALDCGLTALIEPSVSMPPHNMPAPDIVVTNEPDGDGPVPLASVALAVEIADTTAAYDLGRKAAVYAANGVPEYWVVALREREVHQFWQPSSEAYGARRSYGLGEPVEAATIEGLRIETEGL